MLLAGMDTKKQINKLFSKKMSRQDFIKHVAIGAVALVGGGALLRLTSIKPSAPSAESRSTVGYGGAPYGGSEPRSGGRS